MTNTLGTNIAKLRESKKLTQEELGKLSGVSRVSIYKIETGQSTPRDTTLQHIAEALHTTPSALRSNQNESPIPQLDQVKELYGDQGAEEVNELFAKNVGLFAGGKLSQAAMPTTVRSHRHISIVVPQPSPKRRTPRIEVQTIGLSIW